MRGDRRDSTETIVGSRRKAVADIVAVADLDPSAGRKTKRREIERGRLQAIAARRDRDEITACASKPTWRTVAPTGIGVASAVKVAAG